MLPYTLLFPEKSVRVIQGGRLTSDSCLYQMASQAEPTAMYSSCCLSTVYIKMKY